MSVIDKLLCDVPLPRMLRVRQKFPSRALADVAAALRGQLDAPGIAERIRPGARIALAVGSRGLADLPLLVRVTVDALKRRGAEPFIVPGMGSHGGASAEGQRTLLAALGVTEASAGCPIVSSMETVDLGRLESGLAVYMDKAALEADGIVVLNRVKPHTSFTAPIESGLAKMLAIGLGKQKGADAMHLRGMGQMAQNVVEVARYKLATTRVLFGIATVEDAYDRVAQVVALPPESILEREPELLRAARENMPRILFTPLDVLVADRMGKEFSGTGIDPNITGRASTPYIVTQQKVTRMVVLDLSAASHGNATGVGLADICTQRLFAKIDLDATYANHITSTVIGHARIPMIMPSDRRALQLAVKTCNLVDPQQLRLVRIPDTLHLEHIEISESMLDEAHSHPQIEICGPLRPWAFDAAGNLDLSAPTH